VTLFLIGYDEGLMKQYGFTGRLSTDDVVYVRGGHNERGEEVTPLDLEEVVREVKQRKGRTEAFAVSGYFSVRNPEHELRVREVIAGLSDGPVSCGHQLSSRLNAVRRATTTALNAHLILPLGELIRSVRQTLFEMGISAPHGRKAMVAHSLRYSGRPTLTQPCCQRRALASGRPPTPGSLTSAVTTDIAFFGWGALSQRERTGQPAHHGGGH
jgi:hypothetical protein